MWLGRWYNCGAGSLPAPARRKKARVKNPRHKERCGASSFYPLQKILHSFKRLSAIECNKLLQRQGPFWEEESFDHYCRDHEEWIRAIHYTLNNPVKAGIAQHWRIYPFK